MAMGGPKPSSEEGEEGIFSEINITPLTDIFLVLLIIFMVTSSVMASDAGRAGVKVNLPRGATKEITTGKTDITVAITTDGKMVVDGKEVSADTLSKMFQDARAKEPDTQVIVQADEATHHGRVVAVMELAKAAGLRRLAIATRRAR
jgi:biopolymer transport protein ExbD